jgi:penicillin-binding protein 1A
MASDAGNLETAPNGPGAQHSRARREPEAGKRPKAKRRNILWRWRRFFFLMGLLGMAGIAAGVAMVAQVELPPLQDLQQSSFICDATTPPEECNSRTAMATISADEARENVSYDEVPEIVVDAVVAGEDRDFFTHQGINPVGIGRALYRDLRSGSIEQGGSTITQQFVKNRILTNERSLARKLEEAVLAIKVEQEMSKTEIMEGYLNSIYFGRNAYGIQAASRAYFGRDVSELGVPEAALLAGLIRAPELADPERDPEEAARRRRTVLDAMLAEGYIDQQEYDVADAVEFTPEAGYRPREDFRQIRTRDDFMMMGGAYITAYAREEARGILTDSGFTEAEIEAGGWRIYTTIDPALQASAYNAVYQTLNEPDDPHGALVALDAEGRIKAWVGGRDFQALNVDLARQGRQVGSTFKPIALAAAIEQGASLTETQLPAPGTTTIQPPPGSGCDPWEVSNYDEEEAETGYFDLVDATAHSSNTAYGRLMAELTPATVEEMAHKLGMDSELGDCLPVVLGTDNSTPLEMAEVYSTFANGGMHRQPEIIERIERIDQDGGRELIYGRHVTEERAINEGIAAKVTYTLQRVITDGTGHGAAIQMPAAGKTGTTQSSRDAWFCGYVPGLTTSVWMGYPQADQGLVDEETGEPIIDPETGEQMIGLRSMHNVHGLESVTGGSLPAEIWRRFMSEAVEHLQLTGGTFPDVPEDQLSQGEPLIDEPPPTSSTAPQTDATPPTGPGGPDFTPPTGGGPSSTEPDDTTSTSTQDTTTSTIIPPIGGTSSTRPRDTG